ncbi:hypothetical protein GGC63_003789 [Paenibacillus sp. OAS669]|nr:hypothetical protein [Paenibacillus sp. OAS669]
MKCIRVKNPSRMRNEIFDRFVGDALNWINLAFPIQLSGKMYKPLINPLNGCELSHNRAAY